MADPVSAGIALASTAISTAGSINAQRSAQSNQRKIAQTQQALQMAERERMREDELQKTLAKQNAWFSTSGASQESGSALHLANAAQAQMFKSARVDDRSDAMFQHNLDQKNRLQRRGYWMQATHSLLGVAQSRRGQGDFKNIGSLFK